MAIEDRIWELERQLEKVEKVLLLISGSQFIGRTVKVWIRGYCGKEGTIVGVASDGLRVRIGYEFSNTTEEVIMSVSDVVDSLAN